MAYINAQLPVVNNYYHNHQHQFPPHGIMTPAQALADTRQPKLLIIGDSRLAKLQFLQNYIPNTQPISVHSGATISSIKTFLPRELLSYPPSAVYLNIGVNNITVKNPHTRILHLINENHSEAINDISEEMSELIHFIKRESYRPELPVIFIPPYGINLSHANYRVENPANQYAMNQTAIGLARAAMAINNGNWAFSPRIHSLFHHCHKNKRFSHSYKHLYDGTHPDDVIIPKMAAIIMRTIARNRLNGIHT